MQFHSITVTGLHGESVVIYVTDTADVIVDKLKDAFDTDIKITNYNDWDYYAIELDQLPLYSDMNISLMLIFSKNGQWVAMHESDYYSEEDVVVLNCVDDLSNGYDIDFIPEVMSDKAQEHITVVDADELEEEAYLNRGLLESPVGDWIFAYPEMSEPFTTLTIVLTEHTSEVDYLFGNVNVLEAEPNSDNIIMYNSSK